MLSAAGEELAGELFGDYAETIMNESVVIQTVHLTKVYQIGSVQTVAISDISIEVKKGEYVAIMGPSGSGKSTLMHILGLLDRPSSGKYMLDGQSIEKLSDDELAILRNRKIGFVFQSYNLLPRSTTLNNVILPMKYAGIPREERTDRAEKYLKLVGLGNRMQHLSNQLSGGQQQRVAIARALVLTPSLILADEPTGNIASSQASEIMSIFRKLNGEGHTIVMITHEVEIASHAKRIIHIRDGQIVSDDVNTKRNKVS